jgi:uncharacterized cupredoxin-like copper-binding protein
MPWWLESIGVDVGRSQRSGRDLWPEELVRGLRLHDMSRVDRLVPQRARRRLVLVAMAIASAGALTSCGSDSDAAGDATLLEVNLGRFVLEPSVLEAPAGNLELRVTNVDPDMVHDLVVNGKGTRRLAPGQSQTLEMTDVATGEYLMWCDMPRHANAGQVGMLVVNASIARDVASS